LSATHALREDYNALQKTFLDYQKTNDAKAMAQQKIIADLTSKLDMSTKLCNDLQYKLDDCTEQLKVARSLGKAAVSHQFKMLSGMFKVYQVKSLGLGFGHWQNVTVLGRVYNENAELKMKLAIAAMGSGMQLLNQIFKRWQNRELFGCWQGMNNNFKDDYADWKMQQQLAAMNGKLQAEALRKLRALMNIWAGKECARELYNMIQGFKYDKKIAWITKQADAKLKKVRKAKGLSGWKDAVMEIKDAKYAAELAAAKKEIARLTDELAAAEEEIEKFKAMMLGGRHAAFFDKINAIMKAWKFGAFGYMFTYWGRWTKETKAARLEAAEKAGRDELLAMLKALEVAKFDLEKKVRLLEAEKAQCGKDLAIRDTEIVNLKEKVRALDAKCITLRDEGFAEGNKDKEEALAALMAKMMAMGQGAFFQKIKEILNVWKHGSLVYKLGNWRTKVFDAKIPQVDQESKIETLEAALKQANATIAQLEAQVDKMELGAIETQKSVEKKIQELQAKIDALNAELATAKAEVVHEKEACATELKHQEEKFKAEKVTLTKEVSDAEANADKSQKEAKHAETKAKEALKDVTNLQHALDMSKKETADSHEEMSKLLAETNTRKANLEKKIEDKQKLLDEGDTSRTELMKQNTTLKTEITSLKSQMKTKDATADEHRKESEQLRESGRKDANESKGHEAKDKKIADLTAQVTALQTEAATAASASAKGAPAKGAPATGAPAT